MVKLFSFYLVRRENGLPCPDGNRCDGEAHDDDYGSWVSGCCYCRGTGVYNKTTFVGVGFLGQNLTNAFWAERAFQEGYSAGVTDCRA